MGRFRVGVRSEIVGVGIAFGEFAVGAGMAARERHSPFSELRICRNTSKPQSGGTTKPGRSSCCEAPPKQPYRGRKAEFSLVECVPIRLKRRWAVAPMEFTIMEKRNHLLFAARSFINARMLFMADSLSPYSK